LRVTVGGQEIRLLEHAAFREMQGRPGIAMIDMTDPGSEHFRQVVSVYPFRDGRVASRRELVALLDLPNGSLTQRTLIFAVRTHPEGPVGKIDAIVLGAPSSAAFHNVPG
jgi:hypothetical protein